MNNLLKKTKKNNKNLIEISKTRKNHHKNHILKTITTITVSRKRRNIKVTITNNQKSNKFNQKAIQVTQV